jgi:hypothetical protein
MIHADQPILPSRRRIKIIAASSPCLFALYLLSVGAVAKLDELGLISETEDKILRVIYAPVGLLGIIPGADTVFDWYIFDVWKCDSMTTR